MEMALTKKGLVIFFVAIFVLILTTGGASARTLVVNQTDPACSDSPEGLYYGTIQTAINAAIAGDTIIVCPDTYKENIVVNKSNIVIQALGGQSVTIISSNETSKHVVNITDQTNVTLDGFTIRDARNDVGGGYVAGINMENATYCTISTNNVTNISATLDTYVFGIRLNNSHHNKFSLSTSVSAITSETYPAYGIWLGSSNNNIFTNTTIRDIVGTYADGIYIDYGETVRFYQTVIERVNVLPDLPFASAAGIYVDSDLINGSFTDTNISDIAGKRYADGIYIYNGENVRFDPTVIERVNGSNSAYGIYGHIINGSFTDTTITEIISGSGTTSYGVYLLDSTGNIFSGGNIYSTGEPRIDYAVWLENCTHNTINESDIRNNGHGFWLNQSDNNVIERNMIVNNTALAISGVHLTSDSDNNELHENCFYYNGYWYLQALDNGSANNFDRNYWEPPPGPSGEPYLITGTANNRDYYPLACCPPCAVEAFEVPAVTPLGLITLVGLLSAIAAVAIVRKRR